MEEYDDLVQRPDHNGLLDLSHRAWVHLDDSVWDFASSVLILDLSYNSVVELPPALGQLKLMRYFVCVLLT